jgi:hypothetical protein
MMKYLNRLPILVNHLADLCGLASADSQFLGRLSALRNLLRDVTCLPFLFSYPANMHDRHFHSWNLRKTFLMQERSLVADSN